MCVLAPQPPRRRGDSSCRLVLVVEATQVLLLPIVLDGSFPLAVSLVPAQVVRSISVGSESGCTAERAERVESSLDSGSCQFTV